MVGRSVGLDVRGERGPKEGIAGSSLPFPSLSAFQTASSNRAEVVGELVRNAEGRDGLLDGSGILETQKSGKEEWLGGMYIFQPLLCFFVSGSESHICETQRR